uniref:Uncharacterized protein LOC105132278 isoform X1 n=1 Tax=Rhizophora mucronata TaxID=61149 RepID=A0A2P2L4E2_RHIMU
MDVSLYAHPNDLHCHREQYYNQGKLPDLKSCGTYCNMLLTSFCQCGGIFCKVQEDPWIWNWIFSVPLPSDWILSPNSLQQDVQASGISNTHKHKDWISFWTNDGDYSPTCPHQPQALVMMRYPAFCFWARALQASNSAGAWLCIPSCKYHHPSHCRCILHIYHIPHKQVLLVEGTAVHF